MLLGPGPVATTYSDRGSARSRRCRAPHSVLLPLAVVLRRCAPHRRTSAGITVTGVDPGVGSDEPVISAVTARAVMPNQEARAARRAVRGIGADELNHHGRSKRVNRGRRARRERTDVPSDQDAYLNLRVADPHRSAIGQVRRLDARRAPPGVTPLVDTMVSEPLRRARASSRSRASGRRRAAAAG